MRLLECSPSCLMLSESRKKIKDILVVCSAITDTQFKGELNMGVYGVVLQDPSKTDSIDGPLTKTHLRSREVTHVLKFFDMDQLRHYG